MTFDGLGSIIIHPFVYVFAEIRRKLLSWVPMMPSTCYNYPKDGEEK